MVNDVVRSPERRFLYVGHFFALTIVIVVGLLGYWLIDRRPPMMGVTGKFIGWDQVSPNIGHIEWRGVQTRSCSGRAYHWIVNGVVIPLSSREIEYQGPIIPDDGDPLTWRVTFEIPDWLDHTASYRVRIEYYCNPLQKFFPIIVAPPDVSFSLPQHRLNQAR
jgi:hypothetical protein